MSGRGKVVKKTLEQPIDWKSKKLELLASGSGAQKIIKLLCYKKKGRGEKARQVKRDGGGEKTGGERNKVRGGKRVNKQLRTRRVSKKKGGTKNIREGRKKKLKGVIRGEGNSRGRGEGDHGQWQVEIKNMLNPEESGGYVRKEGP